MDLMWSIGLFRGVLIELGGGVSGNLAFSPSNLVSASHQNLVRISDQN